MLSEYNQTLKHPPTGIMTQSLNNGQALALTGQEKHGKIQHLTLTCKAAPRLDAAQYVQKMNTSAQADLKMTSLIQGSTNGYSLEKLKEYETKLL